MIVPPVLSWSAACFLLILWAWERRKVRTAISSRIRGLVGFESEVAPIQSSRYRFRKERPVVAPVARRILSALHPLSSGLPFPVDEELLRRAGSELSPAEFQSLRLLILSGALLLVVLTMGPLALLLAFLPFTALAWIIPSLTLKKRVRRNLAAAVESLPTLLDLLSLLLLSGQGLQPALQKASAACSGPLRSELERVFLAVEMGVPRQQALMRLEERIPTEEMRRFVRSVLRAERFGAPLAEVVESLAAELRHDLRARLQEKAHKAPVKILFPLVFLILPSFLLLTVGGMLMGGRFF